MLINFNLNRSDLYPKVIPKHLQQPFAPCSHNSRLSPFQKSMAKLATFDPDLNSCAYSLSSCSKEHINVRPHITAKSYQPEEIPSRSIHFTSIEKICNNFASRLKIIQRTMVNWFNVNIIMYKVCTNLWPLFFFNLLHLVLGMNCHSKRWYVIVFVSFKRNLKAKYFQM